MEFLKGGDYIEGRVLFLVNLVAVSFGEDRGERGPAPSLLWRRGWVAACCKNPEPLLILRKGVELGGLAVVRV